MQRTELAGLSNEGAIVLAGQLCAVVLNFAGLRLLTHALGQGDYGRYALALTGGMLAQQVIFGPLATSTIRLTSHFSVGAHAAEIALAQARRRSWMLATATVCGAFVGLIVGNINVGLSILFIGAFGTFHGIAQTVHAPLHAERRRLAVAGFQTMGAGLRWGLAVIYAQISPHAHIALAGLASAGLIELLVALWYTRRSGDSSPTSASRHDWETFARFARPFALLGVMIWLRSAMDRWALGLLVDSESVAMFAVLFQIGAVPIAVLSNAAVTFLAPVIFDRAEDDGDSSHGRDTLGAAAIALAIGAAASLTLLPVSGLIVRWFLPGQLPASPLWLSVMALAGSVWACGQLAGLGLITELRSELLYRPTAQGCLLAVALSFVLAEPFGVGGVVVSSLVSAIVYSAGIVHRVAKLITPTVGV